MELQFVEFALTIKADGIEVTLIPIIAIEMPCHLTYWHI
jgi:hypothetical protein